MKNRLLFITLIVCMILNLGLFAGTVRHFNPFAPVPTPNIPQISINPLTLQATIQNCGDSVTLPVTIHNTGGTILNYTIGQATNFVEDFESGLDKWVYNGLWQIVPDAYQGNGALKESAPGYYYDYMSQYIQTKDSFSIANKDSCVLSFWLKYNVECCCDRFYADIQVNNGTWINLTSYGCSSAWALKSFNLSPYVNNGDFVRIRFRFTSDYSVVGPGIGLDNVELKGIGSASPWISPYPLSGAILPGDSGIVNITFRSAGLNAGIYAGYALINSNDPLTPAVTLPVAMTIIGAPILNVSPLTLNFPSIMQHTRDTATIKISNPGCDSLKINSIVSNIPEFYPIQTSLNLAPADSGIIRVVFYPGNAVAYSGTLTISDGILSQGVSLSGTGLPAPAISYNPDTIHVNLDGCNDSLWVHVPIGNTGTGNLNVHINSMGSGGFITPAACIPYTINWCCGMGIHEFALNTIDNITGGGEQSYQDYTATHSTSLQTGQSYPITVITGNQYNEHVRVWIDYNNDGSFNMTNELVFEALNQFMTHSGIINIPQNVQSFGAVRLRVMSEYYNYEVPTPCTNVYYGQTEDYTVYIGSGLSIVPDSLFLTSGDTSHVNVKFDALTFQAGISNGFITLNSNDPVNPHVSIPFAVNKIGYPQIIVTPSVLNFPELMILTSSTDSVSISNPGCDSLRITQIISTNPNFIPGIDHLSLAPGESRKFAVVFSPVDTGQLSASLEFYNNATFTSINMFGHALGAPIITITPSSISASVFNCGDSVEVPITIHNTGSAVLNYHVINSSDFTEDFEHGLDKWKYTGTWQIVPDAYAGTGALKEGPEGYYNNYIYESIEMKDSLRILDAPNCQLSFYLKRSLECCCDALYLYISVNGNTWTYIDQYTCSYDWLQITSNLSTYVNNGDFVKVRFVFSSDGSVIGTGVHLDNLHLSGVNSLYQWVTIAADTGSVAINDSTTILLHFHSLNIPSGIYNQNYVFQSNDPLNQLVSIPISFTINGQAAIALSYSVLNFPSVMQYANAKDSLWVFNPGCDTLFITGSSVSGPDYQVNPDIFYVKPYDSVKIIVTFQPLSLGTLNEELTLHNTVADITIQLNGEGTDAPVIQVHPDSLLANINSCNDSVSLPLTIHNIGNLDLNWLAQLSYQQTNYALTFDGYGAYLYMGYWNPGPQWTLEAWVNPSSAGSGLKNIVGGIGNCQDWAIVMQDGRFGVAIRPFDGSCNQTILSSETVSPGTWYHVAGTNDGNTAKLYVNGILMAQASVFHNYTGLSYIYGGYAYCCYGEGFTGTIDEISIWNLSLPAETILARMHSSLTGGEQGLMAYYDLNEGSGGTIYDKSPYYHTASMGSATWILSSAPVNTYSSINPISGTIVSGDSSVVNVSFNSKGLQNGIYNGSISITSNSTLNPLINISTRLIVNGSPHLAVPDSCLSLGSIMEYTSKTDTFSLFNTGCDTLKISNIYSNSGYFSASPTSFNILPNSDYPIYITFYPTTFGPVSDTLHIISNDTEKTICVNGTATAIPFITVSRSSIDAAVLCDIGGSVSLTVKNLGSVPLSYTFQLQNAPWLQVNPSNAIIAPGDSLIHSLNYSKIGLETGIFTGHIIINSNDPLHNNIDIPFVFDVQNSYKPVELGNNKNVCIGTSVTLNAGSNYISYNWNTGSTDSVIVVTSSGEYNVFVTDNANCEYSDMILINFYDYPVVTIGNDTTICAGTTFTFNPVIQNLIPIAPSTIEVGTGTNSTGNVGPTPFGTYFMDDRTQMLYRSSELIQLGLSAGLINSIAFNVTAGGSPPMQNFTIKIGNTSNGTLSGFINNLTTVYTSNLYFPVSNWNEFIFTQPFYWNGYQNLVVEVCFSNSSWSSSSSVMYTPEPGTVWSAWCDNCAPGCSVSGGQSFNERANIKISGLGDVSLYTWHGPNGFTSHIRNAVVNNIGFQNAGIYTLQVDNSIGCTDNDTIIIAVNPSPVANAGINQSIIYGSSTTLNGSASGGIAPYIYSWTPITALSNPTNSNPIANPLATTIYKLTATGANQCSASDTMKLTVLPIYQISGTISYANTLNSPLNNVIISLKNSLGVVMGTDTTGNDGHFLFDGLINGVYTYVINCQKAWGGVNASDALAISKHTVFLSTLTGISLKSADVNNSSTITAADAMLVLRRTVGATTSFLAGDWVFTNSPVSVLNGNTSLNIQALCIGDVNNSFVPGAKTEPSVFLSEEGYIHDYINNTIDLPIRASQSMNLGAMTLFLQLSDEIEKVVDINSTLKSFVWNQLPDNSIRIAWENEMGLVFNQGDTLLIIKLVLKDKIESIHPFLQVMAESEFAEPNENVIHPALLNIPHTEKQYTSGYLTIDCNPNPFKEETVLTYSIPDDGQVSISLFNVYGQKIKDLVNEDHQKGTFSISIKGKDLSQELYLAVIQFHNKNVSLSNTVRIIKTH